MVLQGHKKKIVKELIRYYVDTTGNDYDRFIAEMEEASRLPEESLTYSQWLSKRGRDILKSNDVSVQDCLQNKDVIRAAIKEDESRMNGEFYTPEIWCVDGRDYLKEMLGDLWGEAYIWDASCGTGNLLKSIDYPMDKIFMSSLLKEDIEMVKSILPDVTAFQSNFVNEIDWDSNNMKFSEGLPDKLRWVLENDKPIVFYMNPPYKVMDSKSSDVGAYMSSIGMAKCALDIFHQFMYRMVMIKRTYNLSQCYMGIFGPVTMFHSKMLEPMYTDFKREFIFHDGMCFDAGDFSNTSESVEWIVGYTAWKPKKAEETENPVVLTVKALDAEQNVRIMGQRLIKSVDVTLHEWVNAKDIVRYDLMPLTTTFENFEGTLGKSVSGALGYLMSAGYAIRATRRAAVTTLPNPDNIPITRESFWRAVASFVSRRVYVNHSTPYNNSQYYSKPNTEIEGYQQWITDALVIYLFDYSSHHSAYRDVEVEGDIYNIANPMFPIDVNVVKSVVTDPTILEDIEKHAPDNQFLLDLLTQLQANFSPTAREFYEHCLGGILESLQGDVRKNAGYAKWTGSWDAGLLQLRSVEGVMPKGFDEKYAYLLSKLKHEMLNGVYKYGFIMDSAFIEGANDDVIDAEDLE